MAYPACRSARRLFGALLIVGASTALLFAGCGGEEFKAAKSGASLDAGTGSGGNGGAGGGDGHLCVGGEDCNDGNPCTVDVCTIDGSCAYVSNCGPTEQCCDGRCSECCAASDCTGGAACAVVQCFAGTCRYMPDDGRCTAEEFCSPTEGCKLKIPCAGEAECEDGDACTSQSCSAGFCAFDFCATNLLCCPDTGCANCCEASDCDDGDPCTVDSCEAGECRATEKVCPQGSKCCAATGACSECCSAAECDDGVDCTVNKCAGGACDYVPSDQACPSGQTCHATSGCGLAESCVTDSDCQDADPCTTGRCSSGRCVNEQCPAGTKCCGDLGCRKCCSALECDDGVDCTVDSCEAGGCQHDVRHESCGSSTPICDPMLGGCIECYDASSCNDGNPCTTDACNNNRCTHTGCLNNQKCCPDGCRLLCVL